MENGMVSGIAVDWDNLTIIMVENAAPEKPQYHFGFPGGVIGRNETTNDAMIREWQEEVWGCGMPKIELFAKIKRRGNFPHYQHLFIIEDTRKKMRKSEVRGETKAPVRVSLWEIASGKVLVFHTHMILLYEFMRTKAPTNKKAAFLATRMAKLLNVEL